ncbi:MAG: prephenate dehydrogenase [Clostridiales bacterium]|jgi:prephenate dehydrogenase|nr:prephenate dehydrogenase [Clostridiales bacterium]
MKIGIAGLGLIGGSLAKAYKRNKDISVFGYDADRQITDIAKISGAIDGELEGETIKECDCIFIALYPEAAAAYLTSIASQVSPGTFVIDCCGTKRMICEIGFGLAEKFGFTFVGGHPMAGTHRSGFKSSTADLFEGSCMIVVPNAYDDIALLDQIKKTLLPAGFSRISVTTAEKHDKIIAFTSQMAHIISNAYIKSPTAGEHKGFSAGSYRDLTRVACLNPDMWTSLFLENRDNIINELDTFIASMQQYRDAVASGDAALLRRLLEDGKTRKEEVDRK